MTSAAYSHRAPHVARMDRRDRTLGTRQIFSEVRIWGLKSMLGGRHPVLTRHIFFPWKYHLFLWSSHVKDLLIDPHIWIGVLFDGTQLLWRTSQGECQGARREDAGALSFPAWGRGGCVDLGQNMDYYAGFGGSLFNGPIPKRKRHPFALRFHACSCPVQCHPK